MIANLNVQHFEASTYIVELNIKPKPPANNDVYSFALLKTGIGAFISLDLLALFKFYFSYELK